ncbi:MAP7 domain-containing protein 2 [Amia ocellicauda]|uniref:MAP7 domain-containing protein 2 n=1 Tax=Amia ocellicauda TaxID=2972642 RepID=UPI00346396CB
MADCAVETAAKTRPGASMAPARVEDRRIQTNGHASPVRLPPAPSSPAGKQNVDGCLKTDDRMRLAKERREERERSLVMREQAIREKERRARLQYERQVEERWRRLEEQRQREELRRTAVEEKRRQRLEEEKERLEALMRRSLERSLQLEQRPKRWTWGGATGTGPAAREGDCENAPPLPVGLPSASAPPPELAAPSPAVPSEPFNATDTLSASTMSLPPHAESPINKRLSSSSATITHTAERAPPSPHRSPYRGSPGRAERRKTSAGSPGSSEDSAGTPPPPDTPKRETERLKKEKRPSCPVPGSPMRRVDAPAGMTTSKRPASPATPKLVSKTRAQSPCTVKQYPPSPMRHRATTPGSDNGKKKSDRGEGAALDRRLEEALGTEMPEKKLPKSASSDLSAREGGERSAEPSPVTPTGKAIAGTTDAEEASRLLAERRRQARLQKELEERQRREQEEAERVKAEALRIKMAEERARQEEEARRAEEQRQRQELEQRQREEEERRQREREERELQIQLEREREEAEVKAQQEAERLRQERELLQLQGEQERLQRKKRIEEIMKRTRKSDACEKKDEGKLEGLPAVSLFRPAQSALLEQRMNGQVLSVLQGTGVKARGGPSPPAAREALAPPLISLQPLDMKSNVDEAVDEVQSMDVSPVSKEELVSLPDFSPVNEIHHNGMSNSKALEDLLDLTGHIAYPKLGGPPPGLGDCNKNLIEGFCTSSSETQLIESLAQSVDKANVQ